jgi:glycosyltransferase involved in cell wall biosynthesis
MCSEEPKISIIMPVYNTGEYLRSAVDSILQQTMKDFELILIDDGSTDYSAEMCDQYGRTDSRIVVLHQANGGISNARNSGLRMARGEYIAFCDHDDEYLPDLLLDSYALAKTYHADIVKFRHTNYHLFENQIKEMNSQTYLTRVYTRRDIKESYFDLYESRILEASWNGIRKRSFLEEHHIRFDEFYKCGGEDIDFENQCIMYASCLVVSAGMYYNHYIRLGFSTSSKFSMKNFERLKEFISRFHTYLQILDINPNTRKDCYTRLIFREQIHPIVDILLNPLCPYSYPDKIKEIKALYKSPYMYGWMKKESFRILFRHFSRPTFFNVLFHYGIYKCFYLNAVYSLCKLTLYKLKSIF